MLFQLTQIEFDFDEYEDAYPEDVIEQEYKENLVNQSLSKVWEVDDEEELADAISDDTGWCIKSLDYVQLAESH